MSTRRSPQSSDDTDERENTCGGDAHVLHAARDVPSEHSTRSIPRGHRRRLGGPPDAQDPGGSPLSVFHPPGLGGDSTDPAPQPWEGRAHHSGSRATLYLQWWRSHSPPTPRPADPYLTPSVPRSKTFNKKVTLLRDTPFITWTPTSPLHDLFLPRRVQGVREERTRIRLRITNWSDE